MSVTRVFDGDSTGFNKLSRYEKKNWSQVCLTELVSKFGEKETKKWSGLSWRKLRRFTEKEK